MKEIIKLIEGEDLYKVPTCYSMTPLKLPFELLPLDYIKFGKEDLKEETTRALVNSISNIKRAIDCRVESLLYLFGAYDISKKENWNFPIKIDFLEKVGVVAPRILRKINKKRNEIEHDFKKPSKMKLRIFLM